MFKYSKIVIGCFAVVFVFYFIIQMNNGKLFRSEFEIDNFTYTRLNTERSSHSHKVLDTRGSLKLNELVTISNDRNKPDVFPFNLRARKEFWSETDINRSAFVFSAYFADGDQVVVIGIKAGNINTYYCQFWYQNQADDTTNTAEQKAKIIFLPESHGLKYTSVLLRCKLPSSNKVPTHVSIVPACCKKPMNLLEIGGSKKNKNNVTIQKFTVCLAPLNTNYNRSYEIIEWIELNRILGAEKFIVYNYSSAQNVQDVLEYYSKVGITEVVQWNIPVTVNNSKPEVHYFGQVAALQDCLYRNKGISEFVVNLDLDEFIIPHGDTAQTWSDMIKQINKDSNVYLFRNTFFKKDWNNPGIEIQNKSLVDKLQLVTLQKLQHERKLFSPRLRSKYITKTAHVSSLMIHEVPGTSNTVVPPNIAFLHHYRFWPWDSNNDREHNKVLDNTVPKKFGNILLKNVLKVRNDIDKRFK